MSELPFTGFGTFFKAPINDLSRSIGVVGIPFDGACSYRPGARFAPNAVRKASMMLTDGAHPLFETVASDHVTDFGDIVVSMTVGGMLSEVAEYFNQHPFLRSGKPIFSIGGDHTVSLGILKGMRMGKPKGYFNDACLIHFDGHVDTWENNFGDPIGHGTWVRNVVEEGIIDPKNIVQIGIRSPVDKETKDWLPSIGGNVLTARQAMGTSPVMLSDTLKERFGNRPVYISFDIDAIDPSFCPGTGTPEIAGLSPHWVLDFLESLKGLNIIGMDVVEVSPAYDVAEITSLTAATLLWTVISMIVA